MESIIETPKKTSTSWNVKSVEVTREASVSLEQAFYDREALVKKHITDQGGRVGCSFKMFRCGSTVWFDAYGYIGDIETGTCVTLRYNQSR